jgi:flagellar assembly factor FliW
MPQCETRYFGTVTYEESIEFPLGLPAFEDRRPFLLIEDAARRPLLFLQSLEDPRLCFITLPVALVDPGYQLKMSASDLAAIGCEKQPAGQAGLLTVAVVSMAAGEIPTANLLAPIIINPAAGKAVQSVRDDSAYSCCHPLAAEVAPCS